MNLNENSIYKIMFAEYNDILTLSDISQILDINIKKVSSMVKNGEIKSIKIGQLYRIPKLALIEYVLNSSSYTDLDFNKWINKEVCDMLGVAEGELKFNFVRK